MADVLNKTELGRQSTIVARAEDAQEARGNVS
jgi:hypothetical protein